MQFVALRDIKEGMCVAEDVRDDQGRTLIARGQLIGTHHIARLRKFHIESLFIDPTHGEGFERPTKSELRERCLEVLRGAFCQVPQDLAAKKLTIDPAAIKEVTDCLVEALMKSKDPLVTLLDINTGPDKLMQHSVNTAVLASVIAIDMHVPETMVKDLAVAMLCHDIGTIFLPESVLMKNGPLSAQEVLAMRQHVQLGCNHLLQTEALGSVAANIILRHHETIDGKGYPQGIGEDKLSLVMRIAQAVEIYDTVTTGRPWMLPVLPDVAISYLINNAGKLFAKEVVITLCQRVALYPTGTAVQFNSGECGIVAGTLAKAPTRPAVLVHVDNRGKPLSCPVIVDLMNDHQRTVVRCAPNLPMLLQARSGEITMQPVNPILANLG